ncbi:uncharacterized protein LOC136062570 [Quercus suber]|uniref:uncharacterized protein LOC136062570 n=1 Tax=Quercus suber TaxID=58331 RepID=UPI0032DE428B
MSHAEKNRDLQRKIEKLKRELRHAKRKRAPSYSDEDPDDESDVIYQHKSKTSASESYTYEEESHSKGQRRSPPHGDVGNDAMSRALNQISRLPFTCRIEEARLPRHFNQPTFTIYNGKTDPVEHEGETLKVYLDRYWEIFNDMEGNFDAMALETFKLGLPTDHGLRTSLSGKPITSMRQLMDYIEKYKRVEEDQQQGKGKEKVIPQDRRDFRLDRYTNSKPRRDFPAQLGAANPQTVNTVFRDPVHQVLEKVKNESFFKWPNKMAGNPDRRNRNLYCQYHQDHGHTTEDCRNLWVHLEQLVSEGKLRHLLHHTSG